MVLASGEGTTNYSVSMSAGDAGASGTMVTQSSLIFARWYQDHNQHQMTGNQSGSLSASYTLGQQIKFEVVFNNGGSGTSYYAYDSLPCGLMVQEIAV